MMSVEIIETGNVETLPIATRPHYPPHVFGAELKVPADVSPSGFEQKEKTCKNCGAVRVTVLGSASPRAWRRTSEGPQITTTIEPPCNAEAGWPR
jgi:hypothetical protein